MHCPSRSCTNQPRLAQLPPSIPFFQVSEVASLTQIVFRGIEANYALLFRILRNEMKMVTLEDQAYFKRRAAEERIRADALPPTEPAAIAHRKLAEQYERGPQQELHVAKDYPRV